jgi:hypothetical protein
MRAGPTASSFHVDVLDLRGPFTVRAVFDRAWHLHNRDGWVVTVTTGSFNGPLAIRVAGDGGRVAPGYVVRIHPPERNPRRRHGASGAALWSAEEVGHPSMGLRVGRRDSPYGEGDRMEVGAGGVDIDLDGAVPWRPAEGGHRTGITWPAVRHDVALVLDAVRAAERGGLSLDCVLHTGTPEGSSWRRHGVSAARALMRALSERNDAAIQGSVQKLIGLGPGLTPAGDDVLCGVLVGLDVFGVRDRRFGAWVDAGRRALGVAVLKESRDRTTTLSRTLLHQAVRGVAVEPLLWLLHELGTTDGVDVAPLLNIGHSSGSDMLTGALLVATVAMKWEEARGPSLVRSF